MDRALIIGATGDAEVRLNEAVRGGWVRRRRSDRQPRPAVELPADGGEKVPIRGLVPDVPPDEPFSFFDLRLDYMSFDYQPRRERANGPTHGLTDGEAATLGVLHGARNVYRHGDTTSRITPVSLVEVVPYVATVLAAARERRRIRRR